MLCFLILKDILIDKHLCGTYNKMLVEKYNQTQEQGCCRLISIDQLNSYLFPDGILVIVYGFNFGSIFDY